MKKPLLVLAALALLASCGGSTTSSSTPTQTTSEESLTKSTDASTLSTDEGTSVDSDEGDGSKTEGSKTDDYGSKSDGSKSDGSKSDAESSDVEILTFLDAFYDNLEGGNMTLIDPDWLTQYVLSDDAIVYDSVNNGKYGYVLYEGERIFKFTIKDDEFKLVDEIIDEEFEGGSLLNYLASPYLLSAFYDEWIPADEEGQYECFNEDVILYTCLLGSYPAAAAEYIEKVELNVNADGSVGHLSAFIDSGDGYNIDLTIEGFGTTAEPLVEAYLADPYPYVKPTPDKDYLGMFAENIRNYRFTAVGTGWETMYGLGPNALYIDYDTVAEGYGAADIGYAIVEGQIVSFTLGETEIENLAIVQAAKEDATIYDYFYTPIDFLYADWEFVEDSTYTTDDYYALKTIASFNGYGNYADYLDEMSVTFADDASAAVGTANLLDQVDLGLTVGHVGTTTNAIIDAFMEDPHLPEAKTDWTDSTKEAFTEYFGEVIPFYPGFSNKMVEDDYMGFYGVYYITDAGCGADDVAPYGAILVENGWVLDEEESETTDKGEIFNLYRKERLDGKQIIVQVEYEPVEVLSESTAAEFPNGRFQILISLFTPPVELEGRDAINAVLGQSVFPELPAAEGATFYGLDTTEEWSDSYALSFDAFVYFETEEACGNYLNAYIALLETAGFEYDDNWEDYENEDGDYCELEIGFDEEEEAYVAHFSFAQYLPEEE